MPHFFLKWFAMCYSLFIQMLMRRKIAPSANLIQCGVVYASRMVVYTLLIIIIGDKLKFIFDKLPIVRRQNNRTFSDFLTFPTINYCVRNDAVTRIIRDIWPTLRVYRIISIWRSKKNAHIGLKMTSQRVQEVR